LPIPKKSALLGGFERKSSSTTVSTPDFLEIMLVEFLPDHHQ
jgi:hypothetical protein